MPDWNDDTIDWYAAKHGDHPSVHAVVGAIPLAGQENILDIGCGTGSALRALAERTSGRLMGVDPFDRMLDHAKARGDARISFQVASAEHLPFADCSFDVVIAINSVSHWKDQTLGVSEACRVLRAGGLLVIGGESFTEPDCIGGQHYKNYLDDRGFNVTRAPLEGGCFVTLAQGRRS